MANLNIRVDDTLKRDAEAIFADLGMSLSVATTVFLKQVVRQNGIPFELRADPFYSKENQDYLVRLAKDMDNGINCSVHELIED